MILGHMVVGPGEADRYLEPVLERATYWADYLHVTLDNRAGVEEIAMVDTWADAWDRAQTTFGDHEGRFRAEAWSLLELCGPTTDDYIVCLDADEIIVDHDMVKPATLEYPGYAIPFRFHEMWTPTQYRVDGSWGPHEMAIMFPYQKHGHFPNKAFGCGRQPTYVANLPHSRVVGDALHYGYARLEDRQAKYDRYRRNSIIHVRPVLASWNKGGLIA